MNRSARNCSRVVSGWNWDTTEAFCNLSDLNLRVYDSTARKPVLKLRSQSTQVKCL